MEDVVLWIDLGHMQKLVSEDNLQFDGQMREGGAVGKEMFG